MMQSLATPAILGRIIACAVELSTRRAIDFAAKMTSAASMDVAPEFDTQSVVYVNGAYAPASEARISPFDRGYLFADAVYEVTAVLDGKLVDHARHAARLRRSLDAIGVAPPMSDAALLAMQRRLIRENGVDAGLVYLQISRAPRRRDFLIGACATPATVFAFAEARPGLGARPGSPIRVRTVPDLRWRRCDVKTTALLGASMAKTEAVAAGFDDAWMVDAAGRVTEASSSNAFIVTEEGVVATRPLGCEILPGVTRAALLRLVDEAPDLRLEERPFTPQEAYAAAEAFQTSASIFVRSVVEVDGRRLGADAPGPVTTRLGRLYLETARATAV